MTSWGEEYDATDAQIRREIVLDSLVECVAMLLWLAVCAVTVWVLGTVRGLALMVVGSVVGAYAAPRMLDRYATQKAPPTEADGARARAGARPENRLT